MLHYRKNSCHDSQKLQNKPVNILVTNRCNVNCMNCSQMCGLFKNAEKWDIPLNQLKNNILNLKNRRGLGIFGGEPTIHPQWDQILKLIESFKDIHFLIYTNTTNPKKLTNHISNISYFKSKNRKNIYRNFVTTLEAPIDIIKIKNKTFYWELAKKNCHMWHNCRAILYDNRAYLCEPAAAFDRLILGKEKWKFGSGWQINKKDPFIKTEEEIFSQAINFCYRCGWCLDRVKLNNKYHVTHYNKELINLKNAKNTIFL